MKAIREKVKLTGVITLIARHADGTIFAKRRIKNTVTSAGKTLAATLLYGTGTAFSAIAIGVGTPSGTALGSESTTNGGARRSGANVTTSNPSGAIAQWATIFTFSGALAITEEGIFNSGTGGAGTMLASQSFSVINVANLDTLTITHQVTLS